MIKFSQYKISLSMEKIDLIKLFFPVKLVLITMSSLSFITTMSTATYSNDLGVMLKEYFFFTNIALCYTILVVALGLVGMMWKQTQRIYRFTLSTAIVLEIMVTITFWILYLIDPKHVIEDHDSNSRLIGEFPKHVFPLVILLIEQRGISLAKSGYHRLFIVVFVTIYYLLSELYLHISSGFLYPFFKVFSPLHRVLFFCFMCISALGAYETWMHMKLFFSRNTQRNK
ncbi:hypothetical protein ENBRE01_0059 [Enteropsectra breve]|nr:hypothetical protein ENBRE01_0059 [Enteropsectra breve]